MTTYYSHRYAEMHGTKCRKAAEKHRDIKAKVYFGSLCKKCDTNLRFSEDRTCVLCSELSDTHSKRGTLAVDRCRAIANNTAGRPILTMHADRLVRQAAEFACIEIYHGAKCDVCGGFYRYTNRGRCMACVNKRNQQYQKVKKTRTAKKKTAPAQTGAAETFDWLFE